MTTKYKTDAGYKNHYFASSATEWRTGTDLEKLIRVMKKGGWTFAIWFVPVSEDMTYDIENYAPKVPDAVRIGTWNA